MTLNGVMAITLRYFTEFEPVFQKVTASIYSICGGMYARVYCILYTACMMSW